LIDYCWNLLQDEDLDYNVYWNANHNFVVHITWDAIPQDVKKEYLAKSIENIKNHKATLNSILTIEKVADAFYPKGHNVNIAALKSALLGSIENQENLIDLVIQDIIHYKSSVNSALKVSPIENASDISAAYFTGKTFSHYYQLKNRLDFMKYCLLNSANIVLSVAQIDLLWQNAIVEAITPEDRDATFFVV